MKAINALLIAGFDFGSMLFFKIPALLIGILIGGPLMLLTALAAALKGGYTVAAQKATAAVKGNTDATETVLDAEVVKDPQAATGK